MGIKKTDLELQECSFLYNLVQLQIVFFCLAVIVSVALAEISEAEDKNDIEFDIDLSDRKSPDVLKRCRHAIKENRHRFKACNRKGEGK